MQGLTLEALRVVLFVLPGIVSLRIKSALSISSPSKPFNAAIDGLILTLIDHALYGVLRLASVYTPATPSLKRLVVAIQEISMSVQASGELGRYFVEAGGFPIFAIAALVGVAVGVIRYHGWEFLALRKLGMTNRTGENLVWAEVMTRTARSSYSLVACKDGSRFLGVVDTFSEEAGNYEVFLSRASQVQLDGTLLPINGEGVLLTRENPIYRVEWWNPLDSEAQRGGQNV